MSFLGGLLGGIGGFITGGPGGAVLGALGGLSGGTAGAQAGINQWFGRGQTATTGAGGLHSAALPTVGISGAPVGVMTAPLSRGFAAGPPVNSLPASSDTGVMTAGATSDMPTGTGMVACDIKGHHLNRSTYYTHSFGIFHKHEKGSTCVKNRRMNVGNAKALRHALRRARGFEKLAMRTIRILHPQKKGRFGGFKTRRRSR